VTGGLVPPGGPRDHRTDMSLLHHPRQSSRRALRRARTARRRATVLAVVLALLAPLALVSTAGAAVAAGAQATLQITRFTAASGATASSPALETDATYASDLGYTVSPATGTVKLDAAYRCASDTEDCVDAAVTFSLDKMRLTTGVAVGGFTDAPVVTYYTDLDAGTTTTDPTAASAFRVSFRSPVTDGGTGLTAGVTGTLSVEAALTTPDGGGTQTGTVVVQPSSAAGTSTPSRVRLIGEFPVALSTSTTLSWARAGYLSGVDDGVETPTNTATIVSTNTGDPAATLTTSWGADPTARPAAGTVGMLDDLTSLRLTAWPTGATSATVTGWTWTGATTAPAQVAVATVASTDAGAGDDLLAGLDATTRAALTGLRVVFTADSGTIASGAAATFELGIREHGSVGSTPTARTGTVDYVTDAPAATFDASSDLNTVTVTGTATTVAVRGTYTSSTSSATRGFRVYDPRAYAGSATTLAALSGGTVYGGGYVRAVSAGTNWSRRAVEQLVVTVRPDQADVTATNVLLDPDLAAIDSRVFGSGLTFAGFGAAKNGSGTGDGSGAALTELVGSGATLTLTVTADGVTTTPVVLDASVASPALPTDPAAFGLTSWSQVTGFTATVSAASGSAVVPMGASVSVPYLLRAATAADVLTYADHTRATTVLGSDTSSVLPRSAKSGNRPVTAATIAVQVPTVGVAGLKHVVEPYVLTSAGSTATAVLEVTARDGASGHAPDTLIVEDSARATTAGGTTGAAWWNVMQPVSVDTGSATGVTTRIEYYVTTSSGSPVWQEFTGTPDDLGDTSAWLGLRLVSVHTDGSTFEDGTTLRSRITFAVRATVLGGQGWTTGTSLTNVARITSEATIEGNTVVSPVVPGSDTVEAVAPGSGGARALLKVLSSLQGVEGTAAAPTATLTWGTAGQDLASVTVTDANGLGDGDGEPSTGAADSFWDTFDLTGVRAITSGATAVSGAAYDPYLAFDQISDLLVYDAVGGAWHSLRDEEWTGTAWEPLSGTRSDVTFAGTAAAGAFPYKGSFPGVSISAGLQARIGGVRLVYEARTDAERATVLAADDWRQALLPTLTTGAVAATDGPTRQVVLALALRDTARSTGTPVNNAFTYNGSAAGKVVNSGRVTGWSGTGATGTATDLGGPINGSGNWTYQVQPASLGATATKSWLRDANGTPLEQSTDLDELALPVDGSDPAAWPTATLTVSGKTTATTRVDSLTITEPRGIDTATTFDASQPFAQYSVQDLVSLSAASAVSGATDAQVVLYRWTEGTGLTADTPVAVATALGYTADTLTDVVGVQVRYTGRIARNATATMTLSTRLLAENRVSGDATTAGLQVDNEVEVAVSDARVCADETGSPTAATGCTPAVVTARADASTGVRDAEVLAFPALAVTPVDVQRDADVATITSTLSVQNFGLTPADQLVLTDADPRYFNAVGVTRVALDALPTGADEASLEVLLAGDALTIDADGAYAGTQTWQDWGTITSGAWDLAALAATHGTDAAAVIGIRVRFTDTNGSLIPAPGQGYGQVTLTGALRTELLTGGLPSAVGAEGWTYAGAAELTTNPGESVRGRISNHISGQALRAGVPSSPQTTADVTVSVHAGAATLRVQKAEVDAASRAPGDLVQYRITLTNTASGTGAADLTGLVLTDRLPEDGSLVYGDAPDGQQPWSVAQSGGMADPTVTADESSVVLTWTDQDRLAPGAQVVVLLWLRVSTDLSTTSVVNVATAGSASRPVLATSTGGDGENVCAAGSYDTTSGECRAAAGALVIGGANVYVSEEWVRDAASTAGAVRTTAAKAGTSSACTPRGTGSDASWYRYPCSVLTTAGSTTDWQIQVTSRASISTDKLEMVDMLSQVGDYPAMSDSGSRGSQWRPVWDGVVPTLVGTYPAGATIEVYTTTADYRSGGIAASEDFDPVPGTWSSTPLTPGTTVPAAQAARVTGFKFVVTFAAADRFSSGESVRVQWSMRTPLTGATEATDTWNSFAFRVPADAAAGRPMDVTSVPLKAGARYAVAAAAADPLVAVGDRVWLDTDRDGIQDDGEAGVAGVVVDLYTAAGDWAGETTTDAAGDYLFDGLPAGDYEIRLTLPAALADLYTLTDLAAGSDPTVDSDAVRESDTESVIAAVSLTADDSGLMTAVADMPAAWQAAHPGLTAEYVDATRDAGLQWRWLSVGDTVWFDADRDGRQGATEDPVVGAIVRLLDADDAVLATTTTDADGNYLFDRLDPGTYRVQVEIPATLADRWTFTQGLVGDALGDSDIVPDTSVTGRSAAFTLSAGVSGRMVRTSDLAGTPVYAGVSADYVDPTVDAGLAERPVQVGDRVWVDLDGDGVQDAGEPGLAGVVLTLTDALGDPVTDASGAAVGPTTTDADGAYAFTDLLPGSYTVTVDTTASAAVLAPYLATPAGASGDRATDSDTGSATSLVLVGGEQDLTLDFGYRPLRAIGDRVWLDTDRDGAQEAGEPGFAGVTVRLLDAATDAVLATTTTDADGLYRFDLLEPGEYRVELELAPADAARYGFTTALATTALGAAADSDAVAVSGTPGTARTGTITVGPDAPGQRASVAADGVVASLIDPTWDAGLVELPVSVGDTVWYDADGDGLQDAGEPGLPGVVLELTGTDGRPVTDVDGATVGPVTTDADGAYLFTGLLPGSYTVTIDRIASAAALAGYAPTLAGVGTDRAVDSSTWTAGSAVLVGGEQDLTLDFGMVLADDVQLALRKSVVSRTADTITWDVTVASTGTQDAYAGFAVVDALPGALSFSSAAGDGFTCTAVAQVVTCDHAGSLPAGEQATVRIVTGVDASTAEVTNTATVDVTGRGYLFEVLSAQDQAISDPVAAPAAQTLGSRLAATGASAALPLGLAVLMLVLGGVLLALRRRA
jgi:uncharacterized repeat protein (TIGR01451 family)